MTSPFASPPQLEPALDAAISAIRADLRDEYLQPHGFPWIVGFSGGKDSTVVAHLVFDLLLSLAPDDRRRPVHIVSNDTLVESPLVMAHIAAVQAEKRMMFIILTLIVAVAAFNLVSTLVMTVTEKQSDIAILRTLGASPRSVMAVFIVQGALIGVIGTALGVAGGLALANNLDVIVPAIERLFGVQFLPREIYFISALPSDPRAGDIVPIALISLALALAATLYPSWRASRTRPAEALRYE